MRRSIKTYMQGKQCGKAKQQQRTENKTKRTKWGAIGLSNCLFPCPSPFGGKGGDKTAVTYKSIPHHLPLPRERGKRGMLQRQGRQSTSMNWQSWQSQLGSRSYHRLFGPVAVVKRPVQSIRITTRQRGEFCRLSASLCSHTTTQTHNHKQRKRTQRAGFKAESPCILLL